MTTMRRTVATATAALALSIGMTGCGAKEVDNGKIEQQLLAALKAKAPDKEYGKVECHDDLKAKVGEKADCDIQVNGTKQKFDAKVTAVEGDTVKFDFVAG